MIILSGNCPRHHNAIMLELTDFDDSKISYLARISRGHHVDTLLVPREYKTGEPMWVHWDNRYVLRGGHILGKCPDENLITTVGYLAYMDDKSIILGRGIENHCDEDGTRRVKDTIHIPMSLVASFGSFD